jgi:hypothetical protein
VGRRERHPVGIVREVKLVEDLVGLLAAPRRGLPDAPYDRHVEVARTQPAQRLGFLELLHTNLHVRMSGLEASKCRRDERITGRQEGAKVSKRIAPVGMLASLLILVTVFFMTVKP